MERMGWGILEKEDDRENKKVKMEAQGQEAGGGMTQRGLQREKNNRGPWKDFLLLPRSLSSEANLLSDVTRCVWGEGGLEDCDSEKLKDFPCLSFFFYIFFLQITLLPSPPSSKTCPTGTFTICQPILGGKKSKETRRKRTYKRGLTTEPVHSLHHKAVINLYLYTADRRLPLGCLSSPNPPALTDTSTSGEWAYETLKVTRKGLWIS